MATHLVKVFFGGLAMNVNPMRAAETSTHQILFFFVCVVSGNMIYSHFFRFVFMFFNDKIRGA